MLDIIFFLARVAKSTNDLVGDGEPFRREWMLSALAAS